MPKTARIAIPDECIGHIGWAVAVSWQRITRRAALAAIGTPYSIATQRWASRGKARGGTELRHKRTEREVRCGWRLAERAGECRERGETGKSRSRSRSSFCPVASGSSAGSLVPLHVPQLAPTRDVALSPCKGTFAIPVRQKPSPYTPPAHGGHLGISPSRHPGCPCTGGLVGISGIYPKPHTASSREVVPPFIPYVSSQSLSTRLVAFYGRQL